MTHTELRRLNRIFEPFGKLDDGRLRIRWIETFHSDLRYFIETSKNVPAPRPKTRKKGPHPTLYVVQADWQMHYWGERLGRGWVIALWKPPIPREQFLKRYGDMAPWNSRGDYEPIENTFTPESLPPNEEASLHFSRMIASLFEAGASIDGQWKGKSYPICGTCQDRLAEGATTCAYCGMPVDPDKPVLAGNPITESLVAAQEREWKTASKNVAMAIDECFPAFNNWPGKRGGSVSFGGLEGAK